MPDVGEVGTEMWSMCGRRYGEYGVGDMGSTGLDIWGVRGWRYWEYGVGDTGNIRLEMNMHNIYEIPGLVVA